MVKFKYFLNHVRKINFSSYLNKDNNSKIVSDTFKSQKVEYYIELEKLESQIEDLEEEYRRKSDYYINSSFKKVINDVNLRYEELKKNIEDYHSSLLSKINDDKKLKKEKFQQKLQEIDKFQIKLKDFEDCKTWEEKLHMLKINLGDVRSKSKLVDRAIDDLTREDFEFKYPSQLKLNKLFGELIEQKHKKEIVEEHIIFSDANLSHLSHESAVNDIKLINSSNLLSASDDGTVKLWNLDSRTCTRTFSLFDYFNSFNCLSVLNDKLLASGSFDKKIRIWEFDTGECIQSINAHRDVVTSLKLLKSGFLLSGSSDCSIKKWNYETRVCLAEFLGHTNAINCLDESQDEKIISGSSDSTIRVWDQNGKCLNVFNGHKDYVLCLTTLDGRLISGSKDKTIKIWNLNNGNCEKTLIGHMEPVSCLWPLKNEQLMSGSWDGTIKLWDLLSGNCLKTIKAHEDRISCLQVDRNGRIYTGSTDKTIKLISSI